MSNRISVSVHGATAASSSISVEAGVEQRESSRHPVAVSVERRRAAGQEVERGRFGRVLERQSGLAKRIERILAISSTGAPGYALNGISRPSIASDVGLSVKAAASPRTTRSCAALICVGNGGSTATDPGALGAWVARAATASCPSPTGAFSR